MNNMTESGLGFIVRCGFFHKKRIEVIYDSGGGVTSEQEQLDESLLLVNDYQ